MARDWGSAQQQLSQERGLGPTQAGKLPPEFLLMAIGIKKDHIFQGIIYGQPKHPLFMRAIAHAFSKEILHQGCQPRVYDLLQGLVEISA